MLPDELTKGGPDGLTSSANPTSDASTSENLQPGGHQDEPPGICDQLELLAQQVQHIIEQRNALRFALRRFMEVWGNPSSEQRERSRSWELAQEAIALTKESL